MSLLLISVITSLGILLGKIIFKKWFNHLTLYSMIFGGSLFLYELKLLPYIPIIPLAWFAIILSFLSFLMGILTVVSSRNLYIEKPTTIEKSNISLKIFNDGGKTLKYTIVIFSILSLYSAYDFWKVLIKQFGSIPGVLINSQVIYRLNIMGEIKGTTPYIFLFGFAAVFLVGIYTAYNGKFTFLTFLPLVSIIIREIALAGRVGMLIALMEFAISFFLFRHLLKNDLTKRYKFSKYNAAFASIILIAFFIGGSSLVRVSRMTETNESFSGANRELLQTKGNIIISPSVYLYASSNFGVLSKYFASDGESTSFGQNTFQSIYLFLAKLDIIKRPREYQKGYFIPMWTNNGTYLRELQADFGITGMMLVPFLIGLFTTWFWFKFYKEKSLIAFTFLVYLYLIIGFSFLLMVTRFYYWTVDLVIVLITIPIIEKVASLLPRKILTSEKETNK